MYHNNIAEKVSTRVHHAPGGRSEMASILGGGAPEAKQAAPARARQSPFATDADTPQQSRQQQQQQQQQQPQQSSSAQERYQQQQAQVEPVGRRVPVNAKQAQTPWGTDSDLPAPVKQAPKVTAPWGTTDASYTAAPRADARAQEQAQTQGSTLHQGSGNPSVRLHAPAGGKSSMSSIMNWGH